MDNVAPSLSTREVGLLAQWERTGISRVTTSDAAALVGEANAAKVLSRLARKGTLDRIGRGIYAVRPLRAAGMPWSAPEVVTVAQILAGRPYYMGGAVALTLHRLTTQQYYSVVDVFVPSQRPTKDIGHAQIVFHTLGWADAITVGIDRLAVNGVAVMASGPERTLLDLVDQPRLLGGSRSALTAVRDALGRVDVNRLVSYALRWPRTTTRQRLGYVLEQVGAPSSAVAALAAATSPPSVVPVLLREPAEGLIPPIWRVRMNDQTDAPIRWNAAG